MDKERARQADLDDIDLAVADGRECIHQALYAIHDEYKRARIKHKEMHSSHEGYAVLLEELEEMWDAIKGDDIPHSRREAIQVAAMALAYIIEVR